MFPQKAEQVGYERDLYTLKRQGFFAHPDKPLDPLLIDHCWAAVEARLPDAVEALLASGPWLDASLWAQTLVPFVAELFVRGPDFNERFRQRWAPLRAETKAGDMLDEILASSDNTNFARVLEAQRLLSPVLRARWTLLTVTGERLVTSDLGVALLGRSTTGQRGYVVPLDPEHALCLEPRTTPRLLFPIRGTWWVPLFTETIGGPEARTVNSAVARFAPRELYGPTPDAVSRYLTAMRTREAKALPELLWGGSAELRRNELDLLDIIAAINQPPTDRRPLWAQGAFDKGVAEERLNLEGYPLPVYLNVSGETGLDEREERELAAAEVAAVQAELAALYVSHGPGAP